MAVTTSFLVLLLGLAWTIAVAFIGPNIYAGTTGIDVFGLWTFSIDAGWATTLYTLPLWAGGAVLTGYLQAARSRYGTCSNAGFWLGFFTALYLFVVGILVVGATLLAQGDEATAWTLVGFSAAWIALLGARICGDEDVDGITELDVTDKTGPGKDEQQARRHSRWSTVYNVFGLALVISYAFVADALFSTFTPWVVGVAVTLPLAAANVSLFALLSEVLVYFGGETSQGAAITGIVLSGASFFFCVIAGAFGAASTANAWAVIVLGVLLGVYGVLLGAMLIDRRPPDYDSVDGEEAPQGEEMPDVVLGGDSESVGSAGKMATRPDRRG